MLMNSSMNRHQNKIKFCVNHRTRNWKNFVQKQKLTLGNSTFCQSYNMVQFQSINKLVYIHTKDTDHAAFHWSQIKHFYPISNTVGDWVLFSIDLFVSFFVSLLAWLRENGWTDLHEIFREGRCGVTMGQPDYILDQFREKLHDIAMLMFLSAFVNISSKQLDRFAWNFQGRCGVTMGRRDSIMEETARCCDAQHRDGVCYALEPQPVWRYLTYTQDYRVYRVVLYLTYSNLAVSGFENLLWGHKTIRLMKLMTSTMLSAAIKNHYSSVLPLLHHFASFLRNL